MFLSGLLSEVYHGWSKSFVSSLWPRFIQITSWEWRGLGTTWTRRRSFCSRNLLSRAFFTHWREIRNSLPPFTPPSHDAENLLFPPVFPPPPRYVIPSQWLFDVLFTKVELIPRLSSQSCSFLGYLISGGGEVGGGWAGQWGGRREREEEEVEEEKGGGLEAII